MASENPAPMTQSEHIAQSTVQTAIEPEPEVSCYHIGELVD
jgi:hypothetical protein